MVPKLLTLCILSVTPVFEATSINQTVNIQFNSSGSICVRYFCGPSELRDMFGDVSNPNVQQFTFSFSYQKSKTNVRLTDRDGNNVTLAGYQSCLHITNASTELITVIQFSVLYNASSAVAVTFINLLIKGKSIYLNILL